MISYQEHPTLVLCGPVDVGPFLFNFLIFILKLSSAVDCCLFLYARKLSPGYGVP